MLIGGGASSGSGGMLVSGRLRGGSMKGGRMVGVGTM